MCPRVEQPANPQNETKTQKLHFSFERSDYLLLQMGLTLIIVLLCVTGCVLGTTTVMIPMRDGVELHTDIDFPLGKSSDLTAVIDRSPYGADRLELVADIFLLWGYAAVRQDMRGTQQSQGNFTIWHSDANDSYDTFQWISEQSWSNGDIYSVGASADGLASFTMIMDSPKWLKAQVYSVIVKGVEGRE